MPSGGGVAPRTAIQRTVSISTGHTVELPATLCGTMFGATFAAPRRAVAELLPDRLQPTRAPPSNKAAVTILGAEYRAVSVPGIEPYDELAVIIPASHASGSVASSVSALTHPTDGYVWYMPVTTPHAKAFGIDVWGFPKVVADITHTDSGSVRETTVTIDNERFVTLSVRQPPSVHTRTNGFSYTALEGDVFRVPNRIDADVGGWPLSTDVSVSFGDHPKAAPLRALDLGDRALARAFLDGEVRFFQKHPV